MSGELVDDSFAEIEAFATKLLAVAPAVAEALVSRGSDVGPDPEFPFVWMGYAGRAISQAFGQMSRSTRTATFGLIEDHVVNGSQSVKEAVATCLLEALASEVSGGRLDGPTLASLLGPESRAYVDAWDQLTLGRSSLSPDYRPGPDPA